MIRWLKRTALSLLVWVAQARIRQLTRKRDQADLPGLWMDLDREITEGKGLVREARDMIRKLR